MNPYPISFVIRGNHIDPRGNTIPYERMTQRSKITDPPALRYRQWKAFVVHCFQEQARQGFPCEPDGYYRLDVKTFVVGENHRRRREHPQRNSGRAVRLRRQARLWHDLSHRHVPHEPRVEVMIDKLPLIEKIKNDR